MAYTLSGLISRVQSKVDDAGFSSSSITNYLNDAQNDVFNQYYLRSFEASEDYSLTIGERDITDGSGLPDNFQQAVDLTLTSSGFETILQYLEYTELEERYPDSNDTTLYAETIPRFWTLYGDTIKVFPAPDAAYTVTLRYLGRPTELSSPSQVPDLPSDFEEYYVLAASARVLEDKDNYDQATILFSRAEDLAAKIVPRYARRQTGRPMRMRLNGNRYAKGL